MKYLQPSLRSLLLSSSLLLLLSGSSLALAGKLTSSVDRTHIGEDETLNLTITYDDSGVRGDPDLAGLDANFAIVNRSAASRTTIINGSYSSTKEWRFVLLPKKSGKLLIPSFQLNGSFTDAIEIEVGKSGTAAPQLGNNGSDLYIEATLDKHEVYIQEMATLTLRLYTSVSIAPPQIPDPVLPNVMVEKIGESQFQTRQNGREYVVVEIRYALVPNQSGKLVLPKQRHEVDEIVTTRGRSLFDDFPGFGFNTQAAKPHYLSTPELTLTVKPQPANAPVDYWLASRDVTITDNWSDNRKVEVGTPLTRVIETRALGNLAVNIPPLPDKNIAGLKIYTEQPHLENLHTGDTLTGVRKENIAIVPTQPGTYTLPEIVLHWWSTKDNEFRTSTIPARTLIVTGAASTAGSTATDSTGNTDNNADHGLSSNPAPVTNTAPEIITPVTAQPWYLSSWLWIGTSILFFILWLGTLLILKHRPAAVHENNSGQAVIAGTQAAKEALKQLKQACRDNNAHRARQALILWAQSQWPGKELNSLQQLKQQIGSVEFEKLVDELDSALYRENATWHGKPLADYMQSAKFAGPTGKTAVELPGLYS